MHELDMEFFLFPISRRGKIVILASSFFMDFHVISFSIFFRSFSNKTWVFVSFMFFLFFPMFLNNFFGLFGYCFREYFLKIQRTP